MSNGINEDNRPFRAEVLNLRCLEGGVGVCGSSAKVLEEVLLLPPFEHAEGHLDGGEVEARGDDGRLVLAVVGQAGHLAEGETPLEEADLLVGQA
jgi:hypothetical protein